MPHSASPSDGAHNRSRHFGGRRAPRRGSLLFAVSAVTLSVTSIMVGLVSRTVERESIASERVLAELRAYWTIQGMLDYGLSRGAFRATSSGGLCAKTDSATGSGMCSDDNARAGALTALINELDTTVSENQWHWHYPGYSDSTPYTLSSGLSITAANILGNGGVVTALGSVSSTGTLPKASIPRFRSLMVKICLNLAANCVEQSPPPPDDTKPNANIISIQPNAYL